MYGLLADVAPLPPLDLQWAFDLLLGVGVAELHFEACAVVVLFGTAASWVVDVVAAADAALLWALTLAALVVLLPVVAVVVVAAAGGCFCF